MSATSQTTELFANFIDPWQYHDRLMFIGCVHAITDEFLWLLKRVEDNPPHYLFFSGDVTGSEPFEHLKTLFYECVFNRAHNQLGIGTDQEQKISDEDLVNFVGHCPRKPQQTLREGIIELLSYTKQLEGKNLPRALCVPQTMTTAELAAEIRHIANRDYFGSWHLELPRVVRQATAKGIETEARKLADALKPIQAAGTKIIMVGGNWDNAENNRQGNWGEDIDVFDTVPFFREQGIEFHDQIAVTETAKALVISVPYWELANFEPDTQERLAAAVQKCAEADKHWRTVILLAHGEPIWEVHNLDSPVPTQEARRRVIENLGRVIATLNPDEVIYPHQHNPFSDKDAQRLPSRTKYLLQRKEEGVEPIRNSNHFRKASDITVSYLPFQRLGVLNIELDDDVPQVWPRGNRDPLYVF